MTPNLFTLRQVLACVTFVSLALFVAADIELTETLLLPNNATHTIVKRPIEDSKLVCYYSNWAIYRPGHAKFTPQNINPFLCTHLIYAFAGLSSKYEMKAFDPYNDLQQGNYKKFVGLKQYNPSLKTMIAIGGWNEGSKRFSKLVESEDLRYTFIKSAMKFLREHNFDGIDFDWEYPAFREGSAPEDKEGYAKLIREIRYAFNNEKLSPGRKRLLVSVAVPAGQDYIDQGFDVRIISEFADFLNVLSYDYHTSFDPETDHHAPLRARPESIGTENAKLNAEWTIKYFISKGAPRQKLIMGIPTYGRSFTLADANNAVINAPAAGPGEPGISTREKGYLAFYEICQKVEDEDWKLHRPHPNIEGPFAVKDKQWVAFDDVEVIQDKARFIIENGLGGAMVWTLDNDDFRGTCYGEQNPLVNALKQTLMPAPSEMSKSIQEVTTSVSPVKIELNLGVSNALQSRRNQKRKQYFASTISPPVTTTSTTTTTTASSFTPELPTTPDPGIEFSCEDEGFFSNPRDCRKYFWCLDSGPANLGIVAHSFTCPSGLFFNSKTEACDFKENVSCKIKKISSTTIKPKVIKKPKIATTSAPIITTPSPVIITGPPPSEKQILRDTMKKFNDAKKNGNNEELIAIANLIKSLGGLERVQALLGGDYEHEQISKNEAKKNSRGNIFFNNYASPKREQITNEGSSKELLSIRENNSRNTPSRQRRPQFDYSKEQQATTTQSSISGSVFNYYEKPRNSQSLGGNSIDEISNINREDGNTGRSIASNQNQRNQKPFSFNYAKPERNDFQDLPIHSFPNSTMIGVDQNGQPIYGNNESEILFSQGTNARRPQQNSRRRQNSSAFTDIKPNINYDNDSQYQIQNSQTNQRKPISMADGGTQEQKIILKNILPSNIFEEHIIRKPSSPSPSPPSPPPPPQPKTTTNIEITPPVNHQFSQPSFSNADSLLDDDLSTSTIRLRPTNSRRRPQNHFNIAIINEESPVSMLINMPPREAMKEIVLERPSEFRQTSPQQPSTTIAPSRATNYNTLPPEFDIAPFTQSDNIRSNANNFNIPRRRKIGMTNTITMTTTTTTASPISTPTPIPAIVIPLEDNIKPTTRQPRRRISRPRRPLPDVFEPETQLQSQPQTQTPAPRPRLRATQSPVQTTITAITTTKRPRDYEESPVVTNFGENFNGPAVFKDEHGNLGCSKRGVHAHPDTCGRFVVCGPAGRGKKGMRVLVHHCPTDQVFVNSVGRCRPGNKDRCEVF